MPPEEGTARQPSLPPARIGLGYDSHRFDASRQLYLGGVLIPDHAGLAGHSDGDAVCHAITDALLGAVAMGDIGEMFPDSSAVNAGRDSIEMLNLAVTRLAAAGFVPNQVDVTVVCETPRIGTHRAPIIEKLSAALGVAPGSVSIKGKTNEGMGWIGRGEGLACMAVASVVRTG